MNHLLKFFIAFISLSLSISAQSSSGGNFTITDSAIVSGGTSSSGGIFAITGAVGQPVIETSMATIFKAKSGFWTPEPFNPTAAAASISGRVLSPLRRGIPNVIVYVTDTSGNTFVSRTNKFGYYKFENIKVGQTLILNAFSKRYQFDTQIVNFDDSITNLDFISQ